MTILGIGIDLVSISSFDKQFECQRTVLNKLFTFVELRDARNKNLSASHHLAVRWAAKEAVIKAWSSSNFSKPPILREEFYRSIEVITDIWGRPKIKLYGKVAKILKNATIYLSLVHEANIAAAVVIIEQA